MIVHTKDKRKKRRLRIRAKVQGTAGRPRLSVFRSNRYILVQLINDVKGVTLASGHSKKLVSKKGTKIDTARSLGLVVAEKAKKKGIGKVVFDRSGYRYHGRVKAVAEGAREGGLVF